MTKKQNRQFSKRAARRTINQVRDFPMKISGQRINRNNYGGGVTRGTVSVMKKNQGEE